VLQRKIVVNEIHSLFSNNKTSFANHKDRSIGTLLHGSEPQEDTSLIFRRKLEIFTIQLRKVTETKTSKRQN